MDDPAQNRLITVLAVVSIVAIVVVGIITVSLLALNSPNPRTSDTPQTPDRPQDPPESTLGCPRSVGLCVEQMVTHVVDGDTLDIQGGDRIRLVLVDAPELAEAGGLEARNYLTTRCEGKVALVDEDDGQIGADPYGRVLAVVYCEGTNANAQMIASGRADTYRAFCSVSEFRNEAWTGCPSSPPPAQNCDRAYPDVCIAPPPPDLDCIDVRPLRNFRVLSPDPHRFDGPDRDGIGCEG